MMAPDPAVSVEVCGVSAGQYLFVTDFDVQQNPKRPKRPTWVKMFVRDLDDAKYVSLSLTVRGFLADFQKLAADNENRVPDDIRFIANRLGVARQVAGKALATCIQQGYISRSAHQPNVKENREITELPRAASVEAIEKHRSSPKA